MSMEYACAWMPGTMHLTSFIERPVESLIGLLIIVLIILMVGRWMDGDSRRLIILKYVLINEMMVIALQMVWIYRQIKYPWYT